MQHVSKYQKEEAHQAPARGCPTVWLPLSAKQRTKFLEDLKGWLPGWGETAEDWDWLESLLDKPKWTESDIQNIIAKSKRGMGFALDQLVGTNKGTQWHVVRRRCCTEQAAMSLPHLQHSVLKTAASSLVEQMESVRRGEWVGNKNIEAEAKRFHEIAETAMSAASEASLAKLSDQ